MNQQTITSIFRCILLGTLLLFLFHFESINLFGDLKISYIWKGIILVFFVFNFTKNKIKTFIYTPFILIAFLQLINTEIINHPISSIINFSITLMLPMMGIFSLQFKAKQIQNALLFFSSFFILAFLPYKLNLLNSIEQGYSLSSFGEDTFGLIGPFQNPHVASTTLANSLIVILFFWFKESGNKIYLSILFILGFYFLLNTYVRTGMIMFTIGVIPILYYIGRKNETTFFRLIILCLLLSFLASNWIFKNELLMKKITGEREYNSENSLESIGSGRGAIFKASIEVFRDANLMEKIIGMGVDEQINRINKKINSKVYSHNAFLNLLLQNGIIGLILFLIFLYRLFRFTISFKSDYNILLLGLFLSYIVMCMVQGYEWVNANLILMLSIGLAYKLLLQKRRHYHKSQCLTETVKTI